MAVKANTEAEAKQMVLDSFRFPVSPQAEANHFFKWDLVTEQDPTWHPFHATRQRASWMRWEDL